MSKVLVTKEKLDSLAESVAAKSGVPLTMTIDGMTAALDQMTLPVGDVEITDNGTVDVTNYEHAIVNVPKATKTLTVKSSDDNQSFTDSEGYKTVNVEPVTSGNLAIDKYMAGHWLNNADITDGSSNNISLDMGINDNSGYLYCYLDDLSQYNFVKNGSFYYTYISGYIKVAEKSTDNDCGYVFVNSHVTDTNSSVVYHDFCFYAHDDSIEPSDASTNNQVIVGYYDDYPIYAVYDDGDAMLMIYFNVSAPYYISEIYSDSLVTLHEFAPYDVIGGVYVNIKSKDLAVTPSSSQQVFNGIELIERFEQSNVARNTYKDTTFTLTAGEKIYVSGRIGFYTVNGMVWITVAEKVITGGYNQTIRWGTPLGQVQYTFDFRSSSYHRVTCTTSGLGNWYCDLKFYTKVDYYDTVTVESIPTDYIGPDVESKTSSDLTVSGPTVTVPSGYYASGASKSVASGTVVPPTTISDTGATVTVGTNALTFSKAISVTPNVTTSGYISSGTSSNVTVSLTANISTRSAANLTASGSTVTVPSGYYSSQVTKNVAAGTVVPPTSISATGATLTVGTNTLTFSKAISVTPSVTTAGYISSGTSGNATVQLTANVSTRTATNLTANGSTVTVPSGYYSSQVTKNVGGGTATSPATISGTSANITVGTNTLTFSKAISVTPTVTAGYISSGTAGTATVSLTANVSTRNSNSLTVSGSTVTVPSGYYASQATKSISGGQAFTPATTITANPTITINSTTGVITATANTSSNVTPTVTAGYVSNGTSGKITVSGTSTAQLTTKAASTITPTESSITAINANTYAIGAITVAGISSTYVGSGVPTKSSANLTMSNGVITAPSGYYSAAATMSLSTMSSTTITPTITSQVAVSAGYYTTGDVVVSPVNLTSKTVTPTRETQKIAAGDEVGNFTYNSNPSSHTVTNSTFSLFSSSSSQMVENTKYQVVGRINITDSNKNIIEYYDVNTIINLRLGYETIVANDTNAYLGYIQIALSPNYSSLSATIKFQKAATYGYTFDLTVFTTNQYVGLNTVTINPPNLYSLTVSATSSVQTFSQPYVATDQIAYVRATGNGTYGLGTTLQSGKKYYFEYKTYSSLDNEIKDNYSANIKNYFDFNGTSQTLGTNVNVTVSPTSATFPSGYAVMILTIWECATDIVGFFPVTVESSPLDAILAGTFSGYGTSKYYENLNIKSIGNGKFFGLSFSSCYFPYVSSIGAYAFTNCVSLQNISLPACGFINNYAFSNCSKLTSIELPLCSTIGAYAFTGCKSLSSVNIPLCKSLWDYAFSGCTNLTYISAPSLYSTVNQGAFSNCNKLESISFPECVYLSPGAFDGCSKLSNVNLPKLKTVSNVAFRSCSSLSSINLPACESIGQSAFSGCTTLSYVSVPSCLEIGSFAFSGLISLTTVYAPSVQSISSAAFRSCTSLSNINISGCIRIYSSYAFTGCTALSSISLPNCQSVGYAAFSNCTALRSINLPSCTYIGNCVFQNCTSLSYASLPVLSSTNASMFTNCTALTNVYLPLCQVVSAYTFSSCTSLSTISLPALTNLYGYAFDSCTALMSVYLNVSSVPNANGAANMFTGTPISNSTFTGTFGSIYVPTSLYNAFSVAYGWSAYKNRLVSYNFT